MIRIADYDFLTDEIQIPFFLGERRLFKLNYKGFRCHIDIFGTPEMDSPVPPREEMKASGHRIAMTFSHPVSRKMPKISFRQGYICFAWKHYKRYYIDTSVPFENYLERYKGKTLSTLKRKVKKVNDSCKSGNSLRIFTSPDEIREFVGIARDISGKTFQYKLLNQGLQDSEQYVSDYLRKAEENRIVGLILYAEDIPVAYNLCPVYGDGVMIYYYTGYDPEFGQYSPGTALQYLTIETAFELEHVNYYDFCAGEGKHKMLYTDKYQLCADMLYFPINLKFFFVVMMKFTYDGLLEIIKYPFKRLGLGQKIRKMVRRRVVSK
ncbi:MAG: GNAT family N-acetyltransferase [Bacteroidota bacterium]